MPTDDRFAGKVVLVTGGASGIGAATTKKFLDEGASVAVIDLRSEDLAGFAESVRPGGDRARTVACDISDSGAVERAVAETVEEFGRLDVVVNNAGVGGIGRAGEVSDEDWRKVMNVDLDGVFNMSRAALPHLVESKGAIVNTASISGLRGDKSMVAYDTAKGAVVNFTRATAVDYGHDGVRVNAVCPGPVQTPILEQALANETIRSEYENRIPLGRVGRPEDIAKAIAFLASNDAAFVSGVNLPVDGGLTAWSAQPDISVGLTT